MRNPRRCSSYSLRSSSICAAICLAGTFSSNASWISSGDSGFSLANNSASIDFLSSRSSIVFGSAWGLDPIRVPRDLDLLEMRALPDQHFLQAHELQQREERRDHLDLVLGGLEQLAEIHLRMLR